MSIITSFLKLVKPERNDYVDVEEHISKNYDRIDANAKSILNALENNQGLKFDTILNIGDEGTKKVGFCYLFEGDIYKCIQQTESKTPESDEFEPISNNKLSERLDNLHKTIKDDLGYIIDSKVPYCRIIRMGNVCSLTIDTGSFLIGNSIQVGKILQLPQKYQELFPKMTYHSTGRTYEGDYYALFSINPSGSIEIRRGNTPASAYYVTLTWIVEE